MKPASIAVAARCIALTKPRHALARSKLVHDVRQAELVVHRARHRRLEVVLAHRRRDQHADLGRVDARRLDRLAAGHRRGLVEGDALGPPAALLDAGQLGQQTRAQAPALVGGGELLVDPVGGDDLGSLDGLHADHAGAVVGVAGIPFTWGSVRSRRGHGSGEGGDEFGWRCCAHCQCSQANREADHEPARGWVDGDRRRGPCPSRSPAIGRASRAHRG